MKDVLVSEKPIMCEKIIVSEKTIIVKKSAPKQVPFKCYIYCTKAKEDRYILERHENGFATRLDGKVIGEFICDNIEKLEEHIEEGGLYYTLNSDFNEATQLDNWQLHDYGKGKPLYGWHISDLKIYDMPKKLSEFSRFGYIERGCACANSSCKYHHDNGYYEPPHCKLHGSGNCSLERSPQSWGYVKEEL